MPKTYTWKGNQDVKSSPGFRMTDTSEDNIDDYRVFKPYPDSSYTRMVAPVSEVKERLRFALADRKKYPQTPIDEMVGQYPVLIDSYPGELKDFLEGVAASIKKFKRVYRFDLVGGVCPICGVEHKVDVIHYTDYSETPQNPSSWTQGDDGIWFRDGLENVLPLLLKHKKHDFEKFIRDRYVTNATPPLQMEPWRMVVTISTHPNEVMMKSTGVQWSSCETIGHTYGGKPYRGKPTVDRGVVRNLFTSSPCIEECVRGVAVEQCNERISIDVSLSPEVKDYVTTELFDHYHNGLLPLHDVYDPQYINPFARELKPAYNKWLVNQGRPSQESATNIDPEFYHAPDCIELITNNPMIYDIVGWGLGELRDNAETIMQDPDHFLHDFIRDKIEQLRVQRERERIECVEQFMNPTGDECIEPAQDCARTCHERGELSDEQYNTLSLKSRFNERSYLHECGWCCDVAHRSGTAMISFEGETDPVVRSMIRVCHIDGQPFIVLEKMYRASRLRAEEDKFGFFSIAFAKAVLEIARRHGYRMKSSPELDRGGLCRLGLPGHEYTYTGYGDLACPPGDLRCDGFVSGHNVTHYKLTNDLIGQYEKSEARYCIIEDGEDYCELHT